MSAREWVAQFDYKNILISESNEFQIVNEFSDI